jgi:hypothetical protein
MDDRTKDSVEFIKVAQDLRKFFHASLWEEEKHYTWFIATILGTSILAVLRDGVATTAKAVIVGVLSFIGLVVSRIAFGVILRECEYFQIALFRMVHAENALYWDHNPVPDRTFKAARKRDLWWKVLRDKRMGVREYFLLTFALSEAAFAVRSPSL